jgi:hypothetical protein
LAYYYIVVAATDAKGVTTANVPTGIGWVGQLFTDKTYIIKTAEPLSPPQVKASITITPDQITSECSKRGLIVTDVLQRWGIGGVT